MKRKSPRLFTVFIGILMAFAAAAAYSQEASQDSTADVTNTFETFQVRAAQIRAEMEVGGRYESVSVEERAKVLRSLDQIKALLSSRQSTERLRDHEFVELANAQELANAILTRNDGDRLVCEHRRPVGTHMKEKYCLTVRERAAHRSATQKHLQQGNQASLRISQ